MVLVKPTTVIGWHRKGYRLYWRRRSRHLGRPGMNREVRELIRQMSRANPLWGAPRIHGELLKLGIEVSQATVGRYPPWRPPPRPGAIHLRKAADNASRAAFSSAEFLTALVLLYAASRSSRLMLPQLMEAQD
jgi:hypothetical protein